MPSYTQPSGATESFGVVYAEAQAAGVPVVAFATGGVPEVVEHGMTGLLAREHNVEELADYLHALLIDERLRDQMSKTARARAAELFSQERQIQHLEAIYTNFL
jgi:glycosyltransferase involved in cell wall biosynthesis